MLGLVGPSRHHYWREHSRIGMSMTATSLQVKPDPGISSLSQSLWQTRMPFSQCQPMAGFGESLL